MITGLLRDEVQARDMFGDATDAVLFSEEEDFITTAGDKRRREFTTVRYCARHALAALGQPAVPLLPGNRGMPVWPDGVVGSMTHCAEYRAAAVARQGDVAALGIDAEPHGPLPDGVLKVVALPEEQHRIAELTRDRAGTAWDLLLFSAKESVYKAWFPVTGVWLGFEDAFVEIDPEAGTFRARLLVTANDAGGRPLHSLDGRWLVSHGLIVTTVVHLL